MRFHLVLVPALALLSAPGLALAQEALSPLSTSSEIADPGPPDLDGETSYGQFLAGRSAMNRGDGEIATAYLARALADSGGERLVRERTFSAAILAGDIRVAASVPIVADESHASLVGASRLARMTQAMVTGRSRDIYADVQANPVPPPHILASMLVSRWFAADAGDWGTALAPVGEDTNALTHILGSYYRALLLEHRRRYELADAQYRELMLDGAAAGMIRLPYGEFLERRGRRQDAIAVYDAGLAMGADQRLQAARTRASSRGRAPELMSVHEGAALAFGHAAAAAAMSDVHEFVIAYLRMSVALNDDNGESWLMLGDSLTEIGMPATAREAWSHTPPDSREYVEAQIKIAASLDTDGQGEEAVRIAREIATQEPGAASAFTLAALLSGHDQHAAALEVLNGPAVARVNDWNLQFLRGAAHEQQGEYQQAEIAFLSALEMSPDQPEILNYLGYMWVDQGEKVEEGLALIERAVTAEPDNGNYQDSLGWARYRQGRYEEAVTILERAVGLEPGSAVINDHLGDAYWQVGRRREAEFQWQRALTLDPTEAERIATEDKLAGNQPDTSPSARP